MAKPKKVKIFRELKRALTDAVAYEQGRSVDLKVVEIPPPPKPLSPAQIREIRLSLNASQATFARFLNVSPNAVESWEQGARRPAHATLKLLNIARKNPAILLYP